METPDCAASSVDEVSWLSVTEASHTAGVGADTIRRWADQGRVTSIRTVGGHRRIDQESLVSVLRHGVVSERSISPVEALDQLCVDGESWYGWAPPPNWSVTKTDEFVRLIADAERTLQRLRIAAHDHLDMIGG